MTETLHATCVAIGGRGVLLMGPSGSGKSDLALRLIDRGAGLVSDDYTVLTAADGQLVASPPPAIAGRIEVRGLDILDVPHVAGIPVALVIDLAEPVERLPERATRTIVGIALPLLRLTAFEASAPVKVELALASLGL
jgi:serine kinase of HPr protein (carbohydrate metabolism regulator)